MGKNSKSRLSKSGGVEKVEKKPKEKGKKKTREKKASTGKKAKKEKKKSKTSKTERYEKDDDSSSNSDRDEPNSASTSEKDSKKVEEEKKEEEKEYIPVEISLEKPVVPGLVIAKQSEKYLSNLLADERSDLVFQGGLNRKEAAGLDSLLRNQAELSAGDEFMIEDGNNYVKYEIHCKYNEGRYSAIYLVMRSVFKNNRLIEDKESYIMKTALRKSSHRFPLLIKREYAVLKALQTGNNNKKKKYCPTLIDYGKVADMPYLVTGLLEKNLEKFRSEKGGFSLLTAFYVAKEVLYALEELHAKGYVYRDLKPTNLTCGVEKETIRIFLLDYGDTVKAGKVIRLGVSDSFTLPYWSLDCHRRIRVTPKTDLESWIYLLIDLVNEQKGLPWKKNLNPEEVAKAKELFWKEYQTTVTDPTILQAVEVVAKCEASVPSKIYAKLTGLLKTAMETQLAGAKFLPDWMKIVTIDKLKH